VVFIARPAASPPPLGDLPLIRATRRGFTGSAEFLDDPQARARIAEYLTDMAGAYDRQVHAGAVLGQSYGEMAQALIESTVSPDEPVDLLILAFSVHDLRPGRQTAAYLSHLTPGAPTAFAVCDQGSAAAFTGLRLARAYAASAQVRRTLLIVVEQAALPYECPVPLPSHHQGVAMLYGDCAAPQARVVGVHQHPGTAPGDVADRAAAGLAELTSGRHDVGLVLSDALAALWTPAAAETVKVMPPGQPSTGVWWGMIDELASTRLLVVADYDPGLRYLCLTAFDTLVDATGSKAASTATSSTARSNTST